MKKIINSPNKRFKLRKKVFTVNTEPSLTDQSQHKQTDINYIYAQHMKTGDMAMLKQRQGQYMDLTKLPDLGEALTTVQIANEAFMSIPAKLRARFNNDPQEFISFLEDPENDAEAIKLGFKEQREAPNLDNSPSLANPKTENVETK